MGHRPIIRPFSASDDLVALTELIHAAYAPQAKRGLRYWGTHQSFEDTRKRFHSGVGFVAEIQNRFVGTITVRPPQPESPVLLYRDPHTWTISQYAVHPEVKGFGLGRELHDRAVAHAVECGAQTIGLDTAAQADGLIAMYRRWGYEVVGEADWRPHTNYVSVVMSKNVRNGLPKIEP
jgi:ribosomal protein S18 acetylase RimI-like enzyme